MLTIRDHNKNEYPLLAVKTVNEELNGNHDIELKVPQQRNDSLDLKEIDKLWEINYKTVDYKIMYIKQITKGDSFYLDVRAIPLFYWDMDKQIVHENKDGHYTGTNAFTDLFNGTGYQYVLVDFVEAIQIEGFGKGETRLEMFKRLIDRFSLEFYIVGKTVYLKKLIGNDTNFMYKYKLNASNVSKSIDASNYFTHIKGFGNFEESSENYLSEAKLKREYTSPLASVLGKYEGKPIVDGRIKDTATMDSNLKRAVEESLEISIEGNLHDVRSIYAEAVPLIGDRVFLIDERINLEQEIRIQSLKQTFDVNDKLVNCEVTFGSESIRSRFKSNLSSAAKGFSALMRGDIKLPTWSLDEVARGMITKIHASENELKYGSFGIQAIDKNNPNNVFGLNSQGWYISTDGGRTARTIATAEGIVADAITTGTLRAITVEGVEIYGSKIVSELSGNRTEINGGFIETIGTYSRTWRGKTSTREIKTELIDGGINFINLADNRSLWFSDFGVSTFKDGDGEGTSSGTLAFFDTTHSSGGARGVTLVSNTGVVALETRTSAQDILLKSSGNVQVTTVGVLKVSQDAGDGYTESHILGPRETTNLYAGYEGEYRFTNRGFYNSGNTVYNRFRASIGFVHGLQVNSSGANPGTNLYLGSLSGEVQIVRDATAVNKVYGNARMSGLYVDELIPHSYSAIIMRTGLDVRGNILLPSNEQIRTSGGYLTLRAGNGYIFLQSGYEARVVSPGAANSYMPIRASNFFEGSSEKFKDIIGKWEYDALSVIKNEVQLYSYTLKNNEGKSLNKINHSVIIERETPIEWIIGDGIDIREVTMWGIRGIQQLAHENDILKSKIAELNNKINKILEMT